MDQLINELTEKLKKDPHYRGRNRRRDHVFFYFTDNHENIINIKITHDEIKNEDFTTLKKYL